MAAGLGFKTFTTGEVLTAADTNGYLMQGVLVFASSAARAAAITSPQEGQYSYLKDTNSTEYYDGAAWIAAPIGDITGVTAGTGISGGGTSGTVTITNSMATEIAAKGDLIVGTGAATFDNLTVGANGTTLVADSTASTGLKWATPAVAASGMTLINRTTYSSAATLTVDGCFTSTYSSYVVVMENIGCVNATDTMRIKFRDSGGNLTAATYYGNALTTQHYNTTVTSTPSSGLTYLQLTTGGMGGQGATTYGRAWYQFQGVGNSSEQPVIFGNHYTTNNTQNNLFGGSYSTSATVTGFQILSSSTNVAGTIAVYGLAEA
jgi:hypothetical protein